MFTCARVDSATSPTRQHVDSRFTCAPPHLVPIARSNNHSHLRNVRRQPRLRRDHRAPRPRDHAAPRPRGPPPPSLQPRPAPRQRRSRRPAPPRLRGLGSGEGGHERAPEACGVLRQGQERRDLALGYVRRLPRPRLPDLVLGARGARDQRGLLVLDADELDSGPEVQDLHPRHPQDQARERHRGLRHRRAFRSREVRGDLEQVRPQRHRRPGALGPVGDVQGLEERDGSVWMVRVLFRVGHALVPVRRSAGQAHEGGRRGAVRRNALLPHRGRPQRHAQGQAQHGLVLDGQQGGQADGEDGRGGQGGDLRARVVGRLDRERSAMRIRRHSA